MLHKQKTNKRNHSTIHDLPADPHATQCSCGKWYDIAEMSWCSACDCYTCPCCEGKHANHNLLVSQ